MLYIINMKKQKLNLFGIIGNILKKTGDKTLDPYFNESFNLYMIARYISMKPALIEYANFINKYNGILNKKEIYKYLYKNIPKQKNSYIKYIKKEKNDGKKNRVSKTKR